MKRIIRWFSTVGLVMAISVVVVSVAFAQSFTGTFTETKYVFKYSVQVPAGANINIDFDCLNGTDIDAVFDMVDSTGSLYARNDDGGNNCLSGLDPELTLIGVPGDTYVLWVYLYGIFGPDYTPDPSDLGDWQVNINCSAACTITPIAGAGGQGGMPLDNRINADAVSGPVALYCTGSLLDVYGVNSEGKGYFAFRAATNVPIPAETELVKFFENIALYHLSTGEWQVNAGPDAEGKTYVFLFYGCPYLGGGTSWMETTGQ